jgi:MSHA pilin protein MshD
LVEVLMASAVLAFSVTAITFAVTSGQMQTYYALHELRATALADALMEEIVSLPYLDPNGGATPGPEAGETTRADYDNIDDFHGFAQAAGHLTDATGQTYPTTYAMFSRRATAVYGTASVPLMGGTVQGITVTVTVTDNKGMAWNVTRFIVKPAT